MDGTVELLIAIFTSAMASSGFWAFLQKRREKKDNRTKLLIGLAHDRILSLGTYYVERYKKYGIGITADEYENLNDYLFTPYENEGGNGSAAKMMVEARKIPMASPRPFNKGGDTDAFK